MVARSSKGVVSRRSLLISTFGIAGAGVLAACAPASKSTPTPGAASGSAAKPTLAPAKPPAVEPTPAVRQAASGRKVDLKLYTVSGGKSFLQFGKIMDLFEKQQNKIGVEVVFTPSTAGAAENPKLMTSLAAGQPPDISYQGDFAIPQWWQLGYMTDYRSYFQRDNFSLDSIWPCLRPTMGWKGAITYVPIQINPVMPLFWNKDMFKAAGLDPEKGPVTIEDIDQYDAAITKKDSSGKVTDIGIIRWSFAYTPGNAAVTWGFAFGGDFTDKDYTKVTCDSPGVMEAFQWVADHTKKIGGPDKITVTEPSLTVHRFGQGHIGMDGLVTASLSQILDYKKDFNYSVGQLPYKKGTPPNPSWGGGWVLFSPKGVKHLDESWELLKWIGLEENGAGPFWDMTKQFTGRMDLPWTGRAKADPIYKPFVEMMEVTRNTRPLIPVSNFYYEQLNTAMEDVAYARKDPKQALTDVKTNVTKEWDRFNKENG